MLICRCYDVIIIRHVRKQELFPTTRNICANMRWVLQKERRVRCRCVLPKNENDVVDLPVTRVGLPVTVTGNLYTLCTTVLRTTRVHIK